MGRLTTHVLDTAHGRPAAGVRIELHRIEGARRQPVAEAVTNDDGRCASPVLEGEALTAGTYELTFHAGAYFDALGLELPEPKFLDHVPVRFGISDPGLELPEPKFLDHVPVRFGISDPDAHYHVPLLLAPFGCATYRGS